MRVELIWTDAINPKGVTEILDAPDELSEQDIEKWGINLLKEFNILEIERYREKARTRTFVSCRSLGTNNKGHNWTKKNLVTCSNPRWGLYDIYQCTKCGIWGKRYGLDSGIRRDYKYKAKAYKDCDTALEFIEKKGR